MNKPTPEEIRKKRAEYGYTQAECAKLLFVADRQWRRWESGENSMSVPLWIYFKNRTIWASQP